MSSYFPDIENFFFDYGYDIWQEIHASTYPQQERIGVSPIAL
jgi:hypothetical protein